jgi:hypothetical protein
MARRALTALLAWTSVAAAAVAVRSCLPLCPEMEAKFASLEGTVARLAATHAAALRALETSLEARFEKKLAKSLAERLGARGTAAVSEPGSQEVGVGKGGGRGLLNAEAGRSTAGRSTALTRNGIYTSE